MYSRRQWHWFSCLFRHVLTTQERWVWQVNEKLLFLWTHCAGKDYGEQNVFLFLLFLNIPAFLPPWIDRTVPEIHSVAHNERIFPSIADISAAQTKKSTCVISVINNGLAPFRLARSPLKCQQWNDQCNAGIQVSYQISSLSSSYCLVYSHKCQPSLR